MILNKNGVIESPAEPVKNKRKYWLNTTKNEMYQLVNNEYVKLTKPINIVIGQEVETGKLVDGKVEYCKRINTGALPNKTQKQIAIGIDVKNITIQKYEGMARNSSNGACKPLPYVNATYTNYNIQVDIWETSYINITTNNDWSSYDTSYIDLYYTKN